MQSRFLITGVADKSIDEPHKYDSGEIITKVVFSSDMILAIEKFWFETGIDKKSIVAVIKM